MIERPDASVVVAAVVLASLLVAGPGWSSALDLGDGTADVRIVEPEYLDPGTGPADHQLRTEPGRFGTAASYVRTPELVVDVTNVSGTPELHYDVAIPAIDADPAPVQRRLTAPGRYRLAPAAVAIPPRSYDQNGAVPGDGTYTGYLLVRVQSFSGDDVVANRTVEVVVDR